MCEHDILFDVPSTNSIPTWGSKHVIVMVMVFSDNFIKREYLY